MGVKRGGRKKKERTLLGFPGPALVILDRPLTERGKEISARFIVRNRKYNNIFHCNGKNYVELLLVSIVQLTLFTLVSFRQPYLIDLKEGSLDFAVSTNIKS